MVPSVTGWAPIAVNMPARNRPLAVSERARLRELERETRELRMENEFLKKAAAYFARDHR